jgi:hypothetical protein
MLLSCVIIFLGAFEAHASGQKNMKGMKTLGLLLNYNSPDNVLDQGYDSDFSGGLKVGYGISKEIGAELAFSSFKFDGKGTVGSFNELTIDCLRANVFYKFDTTTNLYPFATVGCGYYMVDEGADDLGINFGVGIISDLIDINEMFSFDLSWNYHRILNDGKDAAFFEIKAGLNFNFF